MISLKKLLKDLIAENTPQASPAQIKNWQRLYDETKEELKDLTTKVNSQKTKGTNTPEYRHALYQYYSKNIESLDYLNKLNVAQNKEVNLKPQIDMWQKKFDLLKKVQAQARQTTIKNVKSQTDKDIKKMQSQQRDNVTKAKQDSKKKLDDYQMELRKWYEGGKKGPQPQPPGSVSLPQISVPQQKLPSNFQQPLTIKPTGLK
jgi:hypothetical protein